MSSSATERIRDREEISLSRDIDFSVIGPLLLYSTIDESKNARQQ